MFDPIRFLYLPLAQIVIWGVATVGAAILFVKTRSWPAILIIVGSAGYALMFATLSILEFAFRRHWISGDSSLWKNLTVINAVNDVFSIATVFLALGILLHGLRTKRHI